MISKCNKAPQDHSIHAIIIINIKQVYSFHQISSEIHRYKMSFHNNLEIIQNILYVFLAIVFLLVIHLILKMVLTYQRGS